ncbi:glycosyltransferase family 4 protein [Spirosoma validum]|uniref:Glycosyltransferase family 4 protein n=1 Tax=Spirosoma validum TaxID=2771355 RepID=A0A927GC51_9BACT|nr:glycosyltransferase family 4 protein [Spirosoma validum]MBD2752288.1 glycosyltransferase family 4 protein [Spirosoma validum]
MNVLIITTLDDHSPSGVVTYYKRLAEDLRKQDMNVRILDIRSTPSAWRTSMGLLRRIMYPLGTVSRALYEEFASWVGVYLTVRSHRNKGFDLIHAQDARSGAAAFVALNKRVPVVLTCHFNDSPVSELAARFPMNDWFKRRFSGWYAYLFSNLKNYVFVSDYAFEKSKHLLPGDIKKITIRNTVNIDLTVDADKTAPANQLIISNVGYVDARKNQRLLILVGSELRRRGLDNFRIWLIGEGPKRADYEQLVHSLDLTEHVIFYGQQEQPWRLVAQSNLYMHTALNDNCPYSIIEAFAVNTPVLALPVGGIPEMLPDRCGLLSGNSVEAITDQVAMYFDVAHRQQLRQAQADYADQHFNHRKSLIELVSFYHQTQQAA